MANEHQAFLRPLRKKAGRLSIHEKGIREGRWVSRYLCIGCSEEIGVER